MKKLKHVHVIRMHKTEKRVAKKFGWEMADYRIASKMLLFYQWIINLSFIPQLRKANLRNTFFERGILLAKKGQFNFIKIYHLLNFLLFF